MLVYLAENHKPAGEKGTTNCLHRLKHQELAALNFQLKLNHGIELRTTEFKLLSGNIFNFRNIVNMQFSCCTCVCKTEQLRHGDLLHLGINIHLFYFLELFPTDEVLGMS